MYIDTDCLITSCGGKLQKALFLFLIPVLLCWGCEKQQTPPQQEKTAPASSTRVEQNDLFSESIRVSFFIIPPHVFLDKNKRVSGAIYDLIENHIAPEIGMKFQWDTNPTSLARQLYNLKKGKKYISCFLVFEPKRCECLRYSKKPYYYAQPIIGSHKNNPLKEVRKASDINHMVFGYFKNGYKTPFMRDSSIKFDLVGSPDFLKINLKKVISHRIDGIYSPGKASSLVYLQEFGMIDDFRLIDLPEKPTPVHVAFPKNLNGLAEKFDQAFEKLGGQKLYLKILSNYVDVSKLRNIAKESELGR